MDLSIFWGIVQEGGFTAIAVVMIWYVLRNQDQREQRSYKREESFREREAKFIECMQASSDLQTQQMKLLEALTARVTELDSKVDDLHNAVNRLVDRRTTERERGER